MYEGSAQAERKDEHLVTVRLLVTTLRELIDVAALVDLISVDGKQQWSVKRKMNAFCESPEAAFNPKQPKQRKP